MAVLVLPGIILPSRLAYRNSEKGLGENLTRTLENGHASFCKRVQFRKISTISIETAAGVMPGMRAACPIVRGRTSPSF